MPHPLLKWIIWKGEPLTGAYSIDGPWPGRRAISARPRGGDWLEDEVKSWREAGFDAFISLLTPDETADVDLSDEPKYCQLRDIDFVSFPIEDRNVPSSREDAARLLERLDSRLAQKKNVLVHCRQGIGRSALTAVSLLLLRGVPLKNAIAKVSAA
jgi:protein-tyrosine phosphatase